MSMCLSSFEWAIANFPKENMLHAMFNPNMERDLQKYETML